ncbi:MAG: magnesium-translocating P-type ATPase, partial [Elusimicrobia bacterium]|nr:magnesium-translocating P-type ATPase [Elusimicrobiota bacterium]
LLVIAGVSWAMGDTDAAAIVGAMVVLSVVLGYVQEARSGRAVEKLMAMVTTTSTVLRDGKEIDVPLSELCPGDVVVLTAGSIVPADLRLVAAKDFFVSQSALTGESMPVEKGAAPCETAHKSAVELTNVAFLGSNVLSGSARGVAVNTGASTYFGAITQKLSSRRVATDFDRGIEAFTWLMIKYMVVMVAAVFLIIGLTKGDWGQALLFGLAVAVGLTPEMLPMIVTVNLSKGALSMSRKKVIVKRLNSIQNFGAMNVLCTDKTGTLTIDHVILEIHCDVFKNESAEVLRDAYLISHFQTGLKNVLDRAVLKYSELHRELSIEKYNKADEIPFDFSRRMMSVVVEGPDGQRQLLTKGAPESVFKKCMH